MNKKEAKIARRNEYLKYIVEEFIKTGEPVGSKTLIDKYKLDVSSATMRKEMANLEKVGFLEKAHKSSGRIPSVEGYKYYINNLKAQELDQTLKQKLNSIFARRIISIEDTLSDAAKIISEFTHLTLVTTVNDKNELLKSIQLIPLDKWNVTIIMVTSLGRVESRTLTLDNSYNLKDLKIVVQIFNERLIETPLKNIVSKIDTLLPLLESKVKNIEQIIQQFVLKIFKFHSHSFTKVYGRNNIIANTDFETKDKLLEVMKLLEQNSIWKSIEANSEKDETLKISITNNAAAIISKKIEDKSQSHEISVIGPKRMEYRKVLSIFDYLTKLIEGKSSK